MNNGKEEEVLLVSFPVHFTFQMASVTTFPVELDTHGRTVLCLRVGEVLWACNSILLGTVG